MADVGVGIFFVISGYLITTLLVKERARTGCISLKQFYIRRAFRILPPFYFFLAAVLALMALGVTNTTPRFWLEAAAFLRDYIILGRDRWTCHTWSLSVEEHFYLLWPAALAVLGIRRARSLAISLVVLAPLLRCVTHKFFSGYWGVAEGFMFHMRVDGLMIGCALALLEANADLAAKFHGYLRPGLAAAASVFVLVISPVLASRFGQYYRIPFGYTLENLATAYALWYFVCAPASLAGRFLNWKPAVHVGQISYSLYLWGPVVGVFSPTLRGLSLSVGLLFVLSELSWRTVEKGALRCRTRWFEPKREMVTEPAS